MHVICAVHTGHPLRKEDLQMMKKFTTIDVLKVVFEGIKTIASVIRLFLM
jgi:hypothetical protein